MSSFRTTCCPVVVGSCAAILLSVSGTPVAAASAEKHASSAATSVDELARRTTHLADEYVAEFTRRFPDQAELNGLRLATHDGLTDNSLPVLSAWYKHEDRWSQQLRTMDGSTLLGRPEWVTFGFLKEAVESSRQLRVCRNELWPVNQVIGWLPSMVQLAGIQPVGSAQARAEALARWQQLPRYLDTEVVNLKAGVRSGYTTPHHNVELVIEQTDQLLAMPLEDWPFYGPAKRDGTTEFKRQWTTLLLTRIKPAIERYRAYLHDEYLNRARTDIAITAHPNGEACYRASLRRQTTLDREGSEVFERGNAEVERNLQDALNIGRTKLGTGDLQSLVKRISEESANRFTSRDEELAFAHSAVARAMGTSSQWFERLPHAELVVEPYPPMLEKSVGTDSYWPAAVDGSHPGMYRITLYWFKTATRSNGEITAFHEGYPGHHVQLGLASELPAAHPITHLVPNAGFTEGWGRYAEILAEEMQLYSSDYARANRRLWPARGMVVDPGIHLYHWTRERAIAYVAESGRFPGAADAIVDRAIVWPAQLTAYDTGALEILAVREQAQATLGKDFDIREFHDVVLGTGGITLPMLREKVTRWLMSKRAAHQ